MKRRLIYFLLSLSIPVLWACHSGQPSQHLEENDPDLRARVQDQIAEKKRLEQIKEELLQSRLTEAISKYRPIIKKYSKRYGFDWRLITAQIVQESGFQIKARSPVGAHGLMQIMPGTAQEISKELDIEFIMKNPRENITAGIYHLQKQYRYFPEAEYSERTKLALASYNCGVGRLFDAQDIARYHRRPHNYWINVKPYLRMLKESDWQLHLQIWPQGRPLHGYFYGYNETINYVDNVWTRYQAYRKIM